MKDVIEIIKIMFGGTLMMFLADCMVKGLVINIGGIIEWIIK